MIREKSTNTPTARILIVDDHPLVRRGLAELISNEPDLEICGEAEDAPDALQQVAACHPHLVVIDISLKSGNGIELIKQVKARDNHIKMLVSSMHDEAVYAERALRAGALGYISKDEAVTNVVKAIRQVLRGKMYLSSRMTEQMLHKVVAGESLTTSSIETLTDRELEVFELVGKGLTTREIAANLHLSIKTIESHRDNIKTKLRFKNSAELTRRAVQWVMEH